MSRESKATRDDELRHVDEIDELLGGANPNPDRVGCPPRETLIELARRARPISDPWYEHLVKCSPCYREVRALQAEFARRSAAKRAQWVVAAAAVLLIVLTGAWLLTRGSRPFPNAPTVPIGGVQMAIDLRKHAVLRNDQSSSGETIDPVVLPAKMVELTLLLPVGSEPGTYDIALLTPSSVDVERGSGVGKLENFVTTVRLTLDLRSVDRGAYQFAIRRSGDSWQVFPASVR